MKIEQLNCWLMKFVTKDIIFSLKAGGLVHFALSYRWIFLWNMTSIGLRHWPQCCAIALVRSLGFHLHSLEFYLSVPIITRALLYVFQGPGSRSMSGAPGSAYYSFQGQSQQPSQQAAGFRQSQQPSQQQQHYGPLSGYPNFYHSQAGPTLEQQLQMSRDGSLGGPQGQQQKQTPQQIWQNGY